MLTCKACSQPIRDGEDITKIEDGRVFNDGEVEWQDVEYFHSSCLLSVDY